MTRKHRISQHTSYLLIFALAFVATISAQTAPSTPSAPERLTFEVATIRLSKPSNQGYTKAMPGGQEYQTRNMPLKNVMSLMYKVPERQILNAPAWFDSERYDVDAKADKSYNLDQLHEMYKNLLTDRLNLKFHKEVREGNIYALTIDKSGPKMKENNAPDDFKISIMPTGPAAFAARRTNLEYLAWWLGQILQHDERPVVDMTGLTKNYDFDLAFQPQLPPNFDVSTLPPGLLDRPTIFVALQEQLRLKLTAQRGPITYYVIDHVEKPSDN
jgi:uncharacterized protein (TIGR03435 family)